MRASSVRNCQFTFAFEPLRSFVNACASLWKWLDLGDVVFHGSTQNAQFNLRHVEPTTMLGGVMELQLSQDPPCFLWREGFIQGGGLVSGQVVQHNADKLSVWENLIDQPFHAMCNVFFGVLLRHPNMAFVRQGYEQHMQVSHAMPLILIIDPLPSARLGRQTQPGFTDQSASPFIVANQGPCGS